MHPINGRGACPDHPMPPEAHPGGEAAPARVPTDQSLRGFLFEGLPSAKDLTLDRLQASVDMLSAACLYLEEQLRQNVMSAPCRPRMDRLKGALAEAQESLTSLKSGAGHAGGQAQAAPAVPRFTLGQVHERVEQAMEGGVALSRALRLIGEGGRDATWLSLSLNNMEEHLSRAGSAIKRGGTTGDAHQLQDLARKFDRFAPELVVTPEFANEFVDALHALQRPSAAAHGLTALPAPRPDDPTWHELSRQEAGELRAELAQGPLPLFERR
ncbi:hypothetical protein [Mitsuaria sp. GD03876]|uniref:hypothetical protein n=1 Tax=Mitsuaria sp. GD03876 TaxID=2975399 RepID=UPI002447C511|nr:hypothetical protein [Mitsuaria sp. GD03876]MDH0866090.1 hypothetical protein [Mitsuaria sp. GD03876]